MGPKDLSMKGEPKLLMLIEVSSPVIREATRPLLEMPIHREIRKMWPSAPFPGCSPPLSIATPSLPVKPTRQLVCIEACAWRISMNVLY